MISAEQYAQIRRLFFAEHWKVNTIASELGLHHDTVERAIEADRTVADVLDRAAAALRPGARLVYATCSLLADENEAIASAFTAAVSAARRSGSRASQSSTCRW